MTRDEEERQRRKETYVRMGLREGHSPEVMARAGRITLQRARKIKVEMDKAERAARKAKR